MKKCIRCGEEQNLEEFGFNSSCNDGLKRACKKCCGEGYFEDENKSIEASGKIDTLIEQRKELLTRGLKYCNKCKETKSVDNFGKRTDVLDGYKFACNACEKIRIGNWKINNKKQHEARIEQAFNKNLEKINAGGVVKICFTCKIEKPASEYYFSKGSFDGLRHDCIECYNKKAVENNRKNKDHISAARREKGATPEGKEKAKLKRRKFYIAHREDIIQKQKEKIKNNPEPSKRLREKRTRSLRGKMSFWKNSAKRRGIVWDLDLEFLSSLPLICYFTGEDLTLEPYKNNSVSLDRINSSGGYTKDNVAFCCAPINRMKWEFEKEFFVEMCEKVVANKANILLDK